MIALSGDEKRDDARHREYMNKQRTNAYDDLCAENYRLSADLAHARMRIEHLEIALANCVELVDEDDEYNKREMEFIRPFLKETP
jgi:hypothetical protein